MYDDQIDLVFKALAHPERRRILASLHLRPGQSLFEICASSIGDTEERLSRQTISQHLEMLERAGLVETSWNGRTKAHAANLDPLRAAVEVSLSPYL
jgi:DNA-binding transcriptional ArsR family regulator